VQVTSALIHNGQVDALDGAEHGEYLVEMILSDVSGEVVDVDARVPRGRGARLATSR